MYEGIRRSALVWVLSGLPAIVVAQQRPTRADSVDRVQPGALLAYRHRLLGVYDEETGEPIADVQVTDMLSGTTALTTKTGTVTLAFLPDGGSLVRLRKVGYGVQTFVVRISPADTVPITMVMNRAQTLAKVVVTDSAPQPMSARLRDFYDRRAKGVGHFIDEAEMRKHDNSTMSDVLVSHLPGLMVAPSRSGAVFISSSRKQCAGSALATCRVPNCYPKVLVDGVPANWGCHRGHRTGARSTRWITRPSNTTQTLRRLPLSSAVPPTTVDYLSSGRGNVDSLNHASPPVRDRSSCVGPGSPGS